MMYLLRILINVSWWFLQSFISIFAFLILFDPGLFPDLEYTIVYPLGKVNNYFKESSFFFIFFHSKGVTR